MGLIYGLSGPRDMFAKLGREHSRLLQELSSDNFFNFVVTGYHLIDWIKNDPSLSQGVKDHVESLWSNTYLATCRDLANASKHFTLSKGYKNPVVAKVSVISDYGSGRYGLGDYGVGENSILVVLNNGQRCDALHLAEEVVKVWTAFFAEHQLN